MNQPMRYSHKTDPYSSHSNILKLVSSVKKNNLKILDVGCAHGYLARGFQNLGHEVIGIEIDKKAAQVAQDYCQQVFVCNLDLQIPKLEQESFDLIVFGDIIEHLKNPAQVLNSFLPALKRDGEVIISVPNIANIYVRLSLLLGKFDYADKGILDKTHLRF